MRSTKTLRNVVVSCFAASLLVAGGAFAETVAYPTTEDAVFMVDYPADWELTPADEEGGYMLLTGPSGAMLSMRAVPGTSEDMVASVEAMKTYLGETYKNVKLNDPKDTSSGLEGFYSTGSGQSEDGPVVFQIGWYLVGDDQFAEIWYESAADDDKGIDAGGKIMGSVRVP